MKIIATRMSEGISDSACSQTLREVASSPASSAGRRRTSAPKSSDILRISSSSVETTNLSMYEDFIAASIVHAIRGFPAVIRMFFLGTPLDPPRAGMRPSTLSSEGADVFGEGFLFTISYLSRIGTEQCQSQVGILEDPQGRPFR